MNGFTKESLQITLNLISAHVWYADRSGAVTFINERCADYLGLAANDHLRSGIGKGSACDFHSAFLHPDDYDEARRLWVQSISTGAEGNSTFRVRNAEGGYRWFLSRAEPHRACDRTVLGWICINLDVDEQKQSEFYLAEGERLAHAGSWAFDAAGFTYWSLGLFRIHGLEPDCIAPDLLQYMALVHPDDRNYVARAIQNMVATHNGFDFTKRIVRPDGAIRHIRWVGMPANAGGSFQRFVGIGMDVTEHEQLTEALRKSEGELRQIVDLAPQLVGVMGPKGERIYANRISLEYFGVSLDEWLNEPLGVFLHPDDREPLKAVLDRLSNNVPLELELRLLGRDGSYRWFLARYNPLRDVRGQPVRWCVACTDIEDRKKAQEKLQQENVALREEVDKASMLEEIIGTSPALKVVLSRISRVAASDSTVLITGETGTGKELIARAIHRRSSRANGAFVAVNCAAISRELIMSELFGHEKGAFTGAIQRRPGRFELADGGTIFLDEVGELLPETQVALLRVLQEREFERVGGTVPIQANVRVIAATNRDLNEAVAIGSFREDLFYRLNVFPVEMPPLRERPEDIGLLAKYFIDRLGSNAGKTFKRVNKRTLDRLQSYPWPGNVRELQNVIERSVIVCDSEEFTIDDSWLSTTPAVDGRSALSGKLVDHERRIIEEALLACKGQVYGPSGAAKRLGIPRSTLESKIRALKIDKSRFRQ
jgi:PAS domain S-box-containing protein